MTTLNSEFYGGNDICNANVKLLSWKQKFMGSDPFVKFLR